MIHFPRLRTARLDVQLRELTMRDAVALAATPLGRHEAATTAFLALVVDDAAGDHQAPGRWTVQERMMVVAHYMASTSDGGANFAVGDGAFLDYLHPMADYPGLEVDAGMACGDAWRARQLTGDEAGAMEVICRSRFDWIAADMAARMRSVDEAGRPPPDATDKPAAYAEWLSDRKAIVQDMAESEFTELFAAYSAAKARLHHLFELDFDAAGHVVQAKLQGGGDRQAPARFPIAPAIGAIAHILGERAD